MKLIDSRPLQIAMCVLVFIDAAVVVAEILLDMHAIRSQLLAHTRHTYWFEISEIKCLDSSK